MDGILSKIDVFDILAKKKRNERTQSIRKSTIYFIRRLSLSAREFYIMLAHHNAVRLLAESFCPFAILFEVKTPKKGVQSAVLLFLPNQVPFVRNAYIVFRPIPHKGGSHH